MFRRRYRWWLRSGVLPARLKKKAGSGNVASTCVALLANMCNNGVVEVSERKLNLVGVVIPCAGSGDALNLTQVGFHPVVHKMPAGGLSRLKLRRRLAKSC